MLQYIRRPEDPLPSHLDYLQRRFKAELTPNVLWGRLPIGPGRFYADWTSGYIVSEGLQLYEVKYGPTATPTRDAHKHDHEEQAYYVVQGQARVILGDCIADMGAGSLCYAPPGVYHGVNTLGDEPVYMLDIHGFHYDGKTAKLDLVERRVPPGGGVETIVEPDAEGAYYVVSGVATVTVGDETASIGPGGAAYLPRGVPHGYRNLGSRELVILRIQNKDT